MAGPYQPILPIYRKSERESHPCSFQSSWFKPFPSWLEYSSTKDAAFCLPCFIFRKSSGISGQNAFTIDGFAN